MSPARKPTKAVDIYVRVSQVAGRDVEAEGGTAAEQERRCRAQLEALDMQAGEVFKDLDVSGGKTSRPEFNKAKQRIEDGISGGLIVLNLSRFGRNRKVTDDILELEALGGTVISVEEKLDTSTPSGRFALTILAAVNTLYLENVTENWKRAHENHLAKGVGTGRAVAGYRRSEDGKLVLVPEQSETIVDAFKLRASGGTWAQVRDLLNERGVPTAEGGPWLERTASRLLGSRTLLGEVKFGETVVKGAHDPIPGLTEGLFLRVQKTREPSEPRARKEPALLAGILRCGVCGGRMTHDRNAKRGPNGRFYRCRSEHHVNRPTIGAEAVEQYLIAQALTRAVAGGKQPVGDPEAYDNAMAELAEAEADLETVKTLLGTEPPADSKQAQAVATARQRVMDAQEAGTVGWYFPNESEFEGWTPEEIAEQGITTIQARFARLDVGTKRQALQRILAEAKVKPLPRGKALPVEKRVTFEWTEAAA